MATAAAAEVPLRLPPSGYRLSCFRLTLALELILTLALDEVAFYLATVFLTAYLHRVNATVDTHAGQASYTPAVLRIYDLFVLGFSSSYAWRCPLGLLREHYQRHITSKHLDVGVGTGWFLDHCQFPTPKPELHLLDLNPNTLHHVSMRIARYAPVVHRGDVMQPIELAPRFESIGLNYVLHCLPGNMASKSVAIANLARLLAPSGTLFGSTILARDVTHNFIARRLTAIYNRKGIFGNRTDDLDGLRRALEGSFGDVDICMRGCVALFAARQPAAPMSNRSPA